MSRMCVAAGGVAIAAAFSACDLVRPNDPLALDPDLVAVEAVLFAGSQTVHALIGFPNRAFVNEGQRPVVALLNANTSVFLRAVGPAEACADPKALSSFAPRRALGAMECFSATLPFTIESGDRYRIEGIGPGGFFDGEAIVPPGPILRAPVEALVLDRLDASAILASFDLRWDSPPEVALVMYAIQDLRITLEDGSVREDCSLFGNPFEGTALSELGEVQVDLLGLICPPEGEPTWTSLWFDLRLVGFDAAFARFIEEADLDTVREPVPFFGLTGAVGFFSGAGVSEAVRVVVE